LDTSVREAAHQLGLSYNTVYGLFDLFRRSIIRTDSDTAFAFSGEIEMDELFTKKELEFRYNHRQRDLYDDLVKCISEYSRVVSIE
jgi:hypothetical protein